MREIGYFIYLLHVLRLHRRWQRIARRAYCNSYEYIGRNAERNAAELQQEIDRLIKKLPHCCEQ